MAGARARKCDVLDDMSRPERFDSTPWDETRCEVCPLSRVKAGVAVRITQLCAKPEVQTRLRELGLREDQIIKLLTSRTNFICQVCDARLAISEQLAKLIMVEPLRPAPLPVRPDRRRP